MTAAGVVNRRLALVLAALVYAGVVAAFVLVERPGLGAGHFFYVPICLVALATDEMRGALAGILAAGLYVAAVYVTPYAPPASILTSSTIIRLVTYAGVGALVGWYAKRNRIMAGELRQRALLDVLTGIGNARMFDRQLAERCEAGRRFTLVLADIDDFWRINETHGHDAGNAALCRVAEVLRDVAWPTDNIARTGGDEFAFLTHLQPEQARHVCKRVARRLATESIAVSFGTTSYPDDGTAAAELLHKAEDRLFAAKLLNRNRRTVASATRS